MIFFKKKDIKKAVPRQRIDTGSVNVDMIERLINKSVKELNEHIDVITGTDYRIYTISDWLNAQRQADVPFNGKFFPSWVELENIYLNQKNDSQIFAAKQVLQNGILEKEFYISDKDGNKITELSEMFNSEWYVDFQKIVLDSVLKGFAFVQITDVNPTDGIVKLEEVDRKHVRPDLDGIVKNQYDTVATWLWNKQPLKTWGFVIYNDKLGVYNNCVRWWIYKTEMARIWSKYNQLYGIPAVIGKTQMKDPVRKKNLIDGLKNWINNRFMVVDESDSVEVDKSSTGGSNVTGNFETFIRFCDEQISKTILNSTMVLDDGSSRSQSEVHERVVQMAIRSICRLAKFVTDNELIPRLRILGFPIPEGAKLVYDESEKLTTKEKAEILDILARNFNISEEIASDYVGIEINEKENTEL